MLSSRTYSCCLCFALVVALAGCGKRAHVESPDKKDEKRGAFAEESLLKLENQSSFRFRLRFHRKGGLGDLEGSFDGAYLFPDKRSIRGSLTLGGRSEELELTISGDREFRFDSEKRTWVEGAASQETCPLLQLKRTVALGNFQYIGRDRIGGRSAGAFSFVPNLAFLDPGMEKELQGTMWVSESSGLPLKVRARSKDGTISWSMSLSGYNSPVKIDIPVRHRYRATFMARGNSGDGLSVTGSLLGERLSSMGLESVRLTSRANRRLEFTFESDGDRSNMIGLVSRPGSLSVRLARWPEGPVYELSDEKVKQSCGPEADLGFERGSVAKPLVLLDVILSNRDLKNSRLGYDEFSRPIVEMEITPEASGRLKKSTGAHVGKPMAFVVDGSVVSAPVVRSPSEGRFVTIGDLSSIREAKSISVMLGTRPLPLELSLLSVGEIE